jgi:4-carboxymuconolactone decarboxylase
MAEDRAAKGMALVQRLLGRAAGGTKLPAEFVRITIEHLFGDVWQGKDLAIEERSLATCAVLVALGRESEQRLHFRGARNLGIARAKIEALITHVAHYAGWPVAVSAFRVLDEVWTAMDGETSDAS